MRVLPLVAAFIALSGCASDTYWERTWDGALEAPEIVTVSRSPWGQHVQGWTVCDKAARRCTVVLVDGVDRDCVLRHELRHVAGWDHPRHRASLGCMF